MPIVLKSLQFDRIARRNSDIAVVERALAYWGAQDIESMLTLYSSDVVHQLYVCQDSEPTFVERRGKAEVREMLYNVLADFDYLHFEPTILEVRDGIARTHARFVLLHRLSGEELHGSKRFVCTLKDGLFVRINEYQDAALMAAFVGLANWKVEETARKNFRP